MPRTKLCGVSSVVLELASGRKTEVRVGDGVVSVDNRWGQVNRFAACHTTRRISVVLNECKRAVDNDPEGNPNELIYSAGLSTFTLDSRYIRETFVILDRDEFQSRFSKDPVLSGVFFAFRAEREGEDGYRKLVGVLGSRLRFRTGNKLLKACSGTVRSIVTSNHNMFA